MSDPHVNIGTKWHKQGILANWDFFTDRNVVIVWYFLTWFFSICLSLYVISFFCNDFPHFCIQLVILFFQFLIFSLQDKYLLVQPLYFMVLLLVLLDVFAEIIQNSRFQILFLHVFFFLSSPLHLLFNCYDFQFLQGQHLFELSIHLSTVLCLFIDSHNLIAKLLIDLWLLSEGSLQFFEVYV